MKNFPNQASDVGRLRRTLATLVDLDHSGADTSDDGVLGYELARRRDYTFRNLNYDAQNADQLIEARISEEWKRPTGTQGARTNAREMRRTLRSMGLLATDGQPTGQGTALLEAESGSLQERAVLAQALWDLHVEDKAGNSSHPVRIMLRLLAQAPSHQRDGLELALEPTDDSEAEWNRVSALYALPRDERQARLGVSDATIANAKKIFPSMAKAAGLVVEVDHTFALSPDGESSLSVGSVSVQETVRSRADAPSRKPTLIPVDARTIGRDTVYRGRRILSPEEQARAADLVAQRSASHQAIVRELASLVDADGEFYEDPLSFDMVFAPSDEGQPILLFEVKTVSPENELAQVRSALSQLSYYHFFEVSPQWPERAVVEVAVFDGEISVELSRWLHSEDISAVKLDGQGSWKALNEPDEAMVDVLGPSGRADPV